MLALRCVYITFDVSICACVTPLEIAWLFEMLLHIQIDLTNRFAEIYIAKLHRIYYKWGWKQIEIPIQACIWFVSHQNTHRENGDFIDYRDYCY